ncbi:hypothetical protein ACEZCY_21940 [Streptacidiphilus sp. N1-12]|uniref:Uncharacterized protein n=2 Tax=Streptacidiphilus alkalitolerans TaxID=3342712 RepID=A0ABV6WJY2_9ACTN
MKLRAIYTLPVIACLASAALTAPAAHAATKTPDIRVCNAGDGYTFSKGARHLNVKWTGLDHNGTGSSTTFTFSSTSTSTVSSTLSANFSVDIGFLLESASATFGASYTKTQSLAFTNSAPVSTPAGWYAHGEYGEWQQTIYVDYVYTNTSCAQSIMGTGTLQADSGAGWDTWTTSS